jgi:hypothetical protein
MLRRQRDMDRPLIWPKGGDRMWATRESKPGGRVGAGG